MSILVPYQEALGTYAVVDITKLFTLHGLYNDELYVTYRSYKESEARPFKVPNQKAVDGSGNVTQVPYLKKYR